MQSVSDTKVNLG